MRLYQRIIAGGLVIAGLAGLLGRDNSKGTQSSIGSAKMTQSYFQDRGIVGSVPMATSLYILITYYRVNTRGRI